MNRRSSESSSDSWAVVDDDNININSLSECLTDSEEEEISSYEFELTSDEEVNDDIGEEVNEDIEEEVEEELSETEDVELVQHEDGIEQALEPIIENDEYSIIKDLLANMNPFHFLLIYSFLILMPVLFHYDKSMKESMHFGDGHSLNKILADDAVQTQKYRENVETLLKMIQMSETIPEMQNKLTELKAGLKLREKIENEMNSLNRDFKKMIDIESPNSLIKSLVKMEQYHGKSLNQKLAEIQKKQSQLEKNVMWEFMVDYPTTPVNESSAVASLMSLMSESSGNVTIVEFTPNTKELAKRQYKKTAVEARSPAVTSAPTSVLPVLPTESKTPKPCKNHQLIPSRNDYRFAKKTANKARSPAVASAPTSVLPVLPTKSMTPKPCKNHQLIPSRNDYRFGKKTAVEARSPAVTSTPTSVLPVLPTESKTPKPCKNHQLIPSRNDYRFDKKTAVKARSPAVTSTPTSVLPILPTESKTPKPCKNHQLAPSKNDYRFDKKTAVEARSPAVTSAPTSVLPLLPTKSKTPKPCKNHQLAPSKNDYRFAKKTAVKARSPAVTSAPTSVLPVLPTKSMTPKPCKNHQLIPSRNDYRFAKKTAVKVRSPAVTSAPTSVILPTEPKTPKPCRNHQLMPSENKSKGLVRKAEPMSQRRYSIPYLYPCSVSGFLVPCPTEEPKKMMSKAEKFILFKHNQQQSRKLRANARKPRKVGRHSYDAEKASKTMRLNKDLDREQCEDRKQLLRQIGLFGSIFYISFLIYWMIYKRRRNVSV